MRRKKLQQPEKSNKTENESFTQLPTTVIFERAGNESFYVLILSQRCHTLESKFAKLLFDLHPHIWAMETPQQWHIRAMDLRTPLRTNNEF